MNRALFVSDIHLGGPEDPKCELFLRFLDACLQKKATHLFLVGDIFDLWIADRRYFLDRYSKIVEKLRELVAAGMQVHYFEGNHDLDLGIFWHARLGVQVHAGPEYFSLSKLKVRVEHGDQMDPSDRGYIFLRWLLRTRVMRFLGRRLPNSWVALIGERASATSREYTSVVKTVAPEPAREKIRAHAERVFAERPFDLIVSGHVHVGDDSRPSGRFRCVNLGTWLEKPMVLEVSDEGIALREVEGWIG